MIRATSLDDALSQACDSKPALQQSVGGGCINQAQTLTLDNGQQVFYKSNSPDAVSMFEQEAAGLAALTSTNGPRVPQVLALVAGETGSGLLLEYIPSAPPSEKYWEAFGAALAHMHQGLTHTQFGFQCDNVIGATQQVNTWCDSWVSFFAQCRLGFQIDMAQRHGRVDHSTVKAVYKLIDRLDRWLVEPDHSSLIHGDLWSGNMMCGLGAEPVIVDPAVYYAHPEADLAMTEMFGRCPQKFYDAYCGVSPLANGYEERRDLYNLYQYLNHVNLFGDSYLFSVHAILKRFA